MNIRFALLLFILGLAGHEFAKSSPPVGQVTLDLDRPACKIDFTLGAVLHTVHGTFELKEGMLRLDVASGKISGRIVVDVKSGNTGYDERDRSMHREVLESARFPEAVFSPDRLTGQLALTGQSEVGVHGVLRIHGQDHDVTLPREDIRRERSLHRDFAFVDPLRQVGHERSEHLASPCERNGRGRNASRGNDSSVIADGLLRDWPAGSSLGRKRSMLTPFSWARRQTQPRGGRIMGSSS